MFIDINAFSIVVENDQLPMVIDKYKHTHTHARARFECKYKK